jgi:hypothetical protein
VKAHSEIHGNELANRLAKAAARTRDKTISYNRIPLSSLSSELEEETKQQWQKKLGINYKGSSNKTILSKHNRQAQTQNKCNLKLHYNGDRTQENQSLPTLIQVTAKCIMSL